MPLSKPCRRGHYPRRAWVHIRPSDLWRWLALYPDQAKACRAIGVCWHTAYHWLKGHTVPHPRQQEQIRAALAADPHRRAM